MIWHLGRWTAPFGHARFTMLEKALVAGGAAALALALYHKLRVKKIYLAGPDVFLPDHIREAAAQSARNAPLQTIERNSSLMYATVWPAVL